MLFLPILTPLPIHRPFVLIFSGFLLSTRSQGMVPSSASKIEYAPIQTLSPQEIFLHPINSTPMSTIRLYHIYEPVTIIHSELFFLCERE